MGWISNVFVHKALDALGGIDPPAKVAVLRQMDVDIDASNDPGVLIPDSDFLSLFELIHETSAHGRSVPVHIGASMQCNDYGAFGLAFKSARDLLGSYARVARFGQVVTSMANFNVQQRGDSVFMEVIQSSDNRLGLTMTNELAVSAAMSLSREVSKPGFAPAMVHLMSDRPADDRAYTAHFRCPITFGAAFDALEITIGAAREPNLLSDDGISAFFETHLDRQLSQINGRSDLERRIVDHIGGVLSEGIPSLGDVAAYVGMSSRTLQRRLSAEGLAYQDLVVKTRKELAGQLMRRTDYALAEIAFLTGFSDQSAFSRAFKSWHGQTPASYRRGA